jgi:hypothetical protein
MIVNGFKLPNSLVALIGQPQPLIHGTTNQPNGRARGGGGRA